MLAVSLAVVVVLGLLAVLVLNKTSGESAAKLTVPTLPALSGTATPTDATAWTPALEASVKAYWARSGLPESTFACTLGIIEQAYPNPTEFGAMTMRAQTNAQDMSTLQALAVKVQTSC